MWHQSRKTVIENNIGEKPLKDINLSVSYTHLDVYKRQENEGARGSISKKRWGGEGARGRNFEDRSNMRISSFKVFTKKKIKDEILMSS